MKGQIQKAKIIVLDRAKDDPDETIEVMFNPSNYTLTKYTTWSETNTIGTDFPDVNFKSGQRRTLCLELYFDNSDEMTSVAERTDKLASLANVREFLNSSNETIKRPPYLRFSWGNFNFDCVLQYIQQRFIKFNAAGEPVRAFVYLTLSEVKTFTK